MYPGNPSYAGMGPRAIPEEWVRDDKVVHYLIPKTFADWLKPKFGETGLYSLLTVGGLALASKVRFEGSSLTSKIHKTINCCGFVEIM